MVLLRSRFLRLANGLDIMTCETLVMKWSMNFFYKQSQSNTQTLLKDLIFWQRIIKLHYLCQKKQSVFSLLSQEDRNNTERYVTFHLWWNHEYSQKSLCVSEIFQDITECKYFLEFVAACVWLNCIGNGNMLNKIKTRKNN